MFEFLSNSGIDLPAELRASPEATHIAFQGRKPAFFQIEPEARAQHRIDKVLAVIAGEPRKNPWVKPQLVVQVPVAESRERIHRTSVACEKTRIQFGIHEELLDVRMCTGESISVRKCIVRAQSM